MAIDIAHQDWLATRRQGIGGSDMAAIMGLSPFRGPMDVYLEKIGESLEQPDSPYLYWGNILEDVVAQEFARQTGYTVERHPQPYQHPEIPYLRGNIDRLIVDHPGGPAVLEAKTTNAFKARDWDEGAPIHYLIQVLHYLDITGYQKGYLAVLIGGNDFRIVPVERNDALIAEMHEAAAAFWLCVQTLTPPLVDGSEATAQALKILYPQSQAKTVELPEEARHWIRQRAEAKAILDETQPLLTEAENHLKALIGDAEAGTVDGTTVTWKSASRKGFDQKRFESEHPDLAKAYTKQTPYRILRIKEAK
jgi:putative phage-type endonuclease